MISMLVHLAHRALAQSALAANARAWLPAAATALGARLFSAQPNPDELDRAAVSACYTAAARPRAPTGRLFAGAGEGSCPPRSNSCRRPALPAACAGRPAHLPCQGPGD